MASTQLGTAYTAPDRGQCAECGRTLKLRLLDGYVSIHGACTGGGRPPATLKHTDTIHLPPDGQE